MILGIKSKHKRNHSEGLAESFMAASILKTVSFGANVSLLEQNQKEVFEGLKLYNEGKMNLLELLEISQLVLKKIYKFYTIIKNNQILFSLTL